jgi:hypothetical protein
MDKTSRAVVPGSRLLKPYLVPKLERISPDFKVRPKAALLQMCVVLTVLLELRVRLRHGKPDVI